MTVKVNHNATNAPITTSTGTGWHSLNSGVSTGSLNVFAAATGTGKSLMWKNSVVGTGSTSLSVTLSTDDIDGGSGFFEAHSYLTSKEDILVMAVVRERMGLNIGLLHSELAREITPEDRKTAQAIRDYYNNKMMVWKLKDKLISSFRRDMYQFLTSDGTKFEEKMISLAYRMPTFYKYDLEFDKLTQISKRRELADNRFPKLIDGLRKFTPVKRLHRKNKLMDRYEYWMHDNEQNLYVLRIAPTNPLLHLWELVWEKPSFYLSGTYVDTSKAEFAFYRIENWTLVTDKSSNNQALSESTAETTA